MFIAHKNHVDPTIDMSLVISPTSVLPSASSENKKKY